MGEIVNQAKAALDAILADRERRLGPRHAPHCDYCGAVRRTYGRKKEPKLCTPCRYLTEEQRMEKLWPWLMRQYDYELDVEIARKNLRAAQNLEKILAELLRREIEENRPAIEPTGLRVVAGKDVELAKVAARLKRYLKKKD